ncbi:16S rRNA (cytosine(967)-C(5))-methyltransferase RsmB [Paenibacillus larvae]
MNQKKPTTNILKVRTAREAALQVLLEVEKEHAYSNLMLNKVLRHTDLSRQDAGLATEIVYGTIQRLNTIDCFLARFVKKRLDKLEPWVKCLLRLSFYQLYYLDRIPDHAAVNEAVKIAKKRGHQGISGMVNGVLRNVIRQKGDLLLPADLSPIRRIALEQSHPDWLVRRWVEQYGEEKTAEMCLANNKAPKISIRNNILKHCREELIERLLDEGIQAEASFLAPQGIIITGGGNMALTKEYANGDYSIQDESSMLVAELVDPKEGMIVLDCCAAPGGKTTHLAEKMNNKGIVKAFDLYEHKEQLIQEQAERLQLTSVETAVADARKLGERFNRETFDRILLDAPCSGLGVIRRKPDLKWMKKEQDIEEIRKVQQDLLCAVPGLLKPGGILVYSTCTVEIAENEDQVNRFLEKHPDFIPVLEPVPGWPPELNVQLMNRGMVQIFPQDYQSDGFFMVRLRKKS